MEEIPEEVNNKSLRILLNGATIPIKFRSKEGIRRPIPDDALLGILDSVDRPGFSTKVDVEGRAWLVSFMRHNLGLWIDRDWNNEEPTISGEPVMDALRRVVDMMRQEMAAARGVDSQ